jgi:hypothetical protein
LGVCDTVPKEFSCVKVLQLVERAANVPKRIEPLPIIGKRLHLCINNVKLR